MLDAGGFGFSHGGDGSIRAGVIEDDGGGAVGNRHVEELILLVRIVIVRIDQDVVAQFARAGGGVIGFRFEERVLV